MHLLRSIDQQEKQCECTRCYRATLEGQRFNLSEKFIERASIRCPEAPRTTSLSKSLDSFERRLTFKPTNHTAECGGEPTHILVEGDIFAAYRRARRHLPLYFLSGHVCQDRQDRQEFFLLTAEF